MDVARCHECEEGMQGLREELDAHCAAEKQTLKAALEATCSRELAELQEALEATKAALAKANDELTSSRQRVEQQVEEEAFQARRLFEGNLRAAAQQANGKAKDEHSADDDASDDDVSIEVTSPFFVENICMAALCLLMAAFAAGLTMGLVSLEPHDMEVILRQEESDMPNDEEKQRLREDKASAEKIAPLVHDHHRLLVTLLLLNSIANEALPLFLDAVLPSYCAVLVSVLGVLMFGEIIPSAIFTGSQQLKIAAFFSPLVKIAQYLLYPVAVPIARLLDAVLGAEHKGRYNFAELRAVLGYHSNLGVPKTTIKFQSVDDYGLGIITSASPHALGDDSQLTYEGSSRVLEQGVIYHAKPCPPTRGKRDTGCTFKLYYDSRRHQEDLITFQAGDLTDGVFEAYERDEVKIIKGVISITNLTAGLVMRPLSEVWMLDNTTKLTREKLAEIERAGFSRIPIFDTWPHNIRGYILAKSLIKVTPQDGEKSQTVGDIECKELVVEHPSISLLDLLNVFQAKRCHLGLLASDPQKVKASWASGEPLPCDVHMAGCITLEDIIEKILGEDIDDEHDGQNPVSAYSSIPPMVRKPSRGGLATKDRRGTQSLGSPEARSRRGGSTPNGLPIDPIRATAPAAAFNASSLQEPLLPRLSDSGS